MSEHDADCVCMDCLGEPGADLAALRSEHAALTRELAEQGEIRMDLSNTVASLSEANAALVQRAEAAEWERDRWKRGYIDLAAKCNAQAELIARLRDGITPHVITIAEQIGCQCPDGTDTSDGYHEAAFCNAVSAIQRMISDAATTAPEPAPDAESVWNAVASLNRSQSTKRWVQVILLNAGNPAQIAEIVDEISASSEPAPDASDAVLNVQFIAGEDVDDQIFQASRVVEVVAGHRVLVDEREVAHFVDGRWCTNDGKIYSLFDVRVVTPAPVLTCKARAAGTAGGNDPQECDWPVCGCDPHADKVIEALQERGALTEPAPDAREAGCICGHRYLQHAPEGRNCGQVRCLCSQFNLPFQEPAASPPVGSGED